MKMYKATLLRALLSKSNGLTSK